MGFWECGFCAFCLSLALAGGFFLSFLALGSSRTSADSAWLDAGSSVLLQPNRASVRPRRTTGNLFRMVRHIPCLLYTSDAADDLLCVDLGGRRIIKKKKP